MLNTPAIKVSHRFSDQSASPFAHRPEIDGLRAFAILPIIGLHCGIPGLRGGFVGVDVFFVISGYLLTAIISREIETGTFTLTSFYRRRIVRILPALFAMLAITLALGCLWLLPRQLHNLGASATAAGLFASNFYFYATIDYFSQSADMMPLIHTWSLAVEEQFYVLYPLLLLALRGRSRAQRIWVLTLLALVSFAIGGLCSFVDKPAGFYLLPARIWELALGGLVALGGFPDFRSVAWRTFLALGSLGTLVLACIATGAGWPFPVPAAIPPAGAAALIIAYSPGTPIARLLSLRPLRWIGLISYSLYLWHRPVITYYLLGRSNALDGLDSLNLLALCTGAAVLSFVLVERPILNRFRKGTTKIPHALAVAGLATFAIIGLLVAANASQIRPLPANVSKVASYIGFDRTPAGWAQYDRFHCFTVPNGADYDPACMRLATDRPNLLLIGDSHAAQLSQALREQLPDVHLVQATAAGCRPVIDGRGLKRCRRIVLDALLHTDLSRVSAVLIAGRWWPGEALPLANTIRHLRKSNVPVYVMGPMVEYNGTVPDLLARAMLAGDPQRILQYRKKDRAEVDTLFARTVSDAGGHYISYFPIECPKQKCRLFMPDGAPMHIDESHLTPSAARMVVRRIIKVMKPSLQLRRHNTKPGRMP